ncbi:MAG: isoprenylcysteine carboxylmethyltransferase family protein [Syntrophobacteraceae bacterium]
MAFSWANAFLIILAAERAVELVISRRNEMHLKKLGGKESGAAFTRLLVGFHVCWFFSFGMEAAARGANLLCSPKLLILVFLLFRVWHYWCVLSLGRFWNIKIIAIPGAELVRAGPYRFLKHPIYIGVLLETFVYPALFGCWVTALIFGFSNILVLKKRIRQEETAWGI